jgi:formamidopyrimidine-DNA glycosylase
VLEADLAAFQAALTSESHTLKRALTDPHLLSGIGNSYSDEILHRARLSPFQLTRNLVLEETATLFRACREVLTGWTEYLRAETGDRFPDKVTATHEGMAVHGRFGKPCPVCGTPVQRLVYADSEANYCPYLPDRRPVAGRPRPVPASQEGLPADVGGAEARKRGGLA